MEGPLRVEEEGEEEEVLLPAYAAHGDPDHPVIVRVLVDQVPTRRDADRLAGTPQSELMHELGKRLAAHVESRSTSSLRATIGRR